MSYTVGISENKKYVTAKVVDEINRKVAMAYAIEANKLMREYGIKKILLDATEAVNTDSTVEQYEFSYKEMKTPEIDLTAIVAMVVSEGDHSHDFIETTSLNAGINARIFNTFEEALAFLEEN